MSAPQPDEFVAAAPSAASWLPKAAGPLPEDWFTEPDEAAAADDGEWGDFAAAGAGSQAPQLHPPVAGSNSGPSFSKAETVWYLDARTGSWVAAQVVHVDVSFHPVSYGVELAGGSFRETEAHRLRQRQPGVPPPPPPATLKSAGTTSHLAAYEVPAAHTGAHGANGYAASTVPGLEAAAGASRGQHAPAAAGVAQVLAAEEEDEFGDFADASWPAPLAAAAVEAAPISLQQQPVAALPVAAAGGTWVQPSHLQPSSLPSASSSQANSFAGRHLLPQGASAATATVPAAAAGGAPGAAPHWQHQQQGQGQESKVKADDFGDFEGAAADEQPSVAQAAVAQQQQQQPLPAQTALPPAAAAAAATTPPPVATAVLVPVPAGVQRDSPLPLDLFGEEEADEAAEAASEAAACAASAAAGWLQQPGQWVPPAPLAQLAQQAGVALAADGWGSEEDEFEDFQGPTEQLAPPQQLPAQQLPAQHEMQKAPSAQLPRHLPLADGEHAAEPGTAGTAAVAPLEAAWWGGDGDGDTSAEVEADGDGFAGFVVPGQAAQPPQQQQQEQQQDWQQEWQQAPLAQADASGGAWDAGALSTPAPETAAAAAAAGAAGEWADADSDDGFVDFVPPAEAWVEQQPQQLQPRPQQPQPQLPQQEQERQQEWPSPHLPTTFTDPSGRRLAVDYPDRFVRQPPLQEQLQPDAWDEEAVAFAGGEAAVEAGPAVAAEPWGEESSEPASTPATSQAAADSALHPAQQQQQQQQQSPPASPSAVLPALHPLAVAAALPPFAPSGTSTGAAAAAVAAGVGSEVVTEYAVAWARLLQAAVQQLQASVEVWAEAGRQGCWQALHELPAVQQHLAACYQLYCAAAVVRLAAQQLGMLSVVPELQEGWAQVQAAWQSLPPAPEPPADSEAEAAGDTEEEAEAAAAAAEAEAEVAAEAEAEAEAGAEAEARPDSGQSGEQSEQQQQQAGEQQASAAASSGEPAAAPGAAGAVGAARQQQQPPFREAVLAAAGAGAGAGAAGSPASGGGSPASDGGSSVAAELPWLAAVEAAPALLESMSWDEFPRMLAWSDGLCGLTLLPLSLFEGCAPVAAFGEEARPCLVPLANLWLHCISSTPPQLD